MKASELNVGDLFKTKFQRKYRKVIYIDLDTTAWQENDSNMGKIYIMVDSCRMRGCEIILHPDEEIDFLESSDCDPNKVIEFKSKLPF